MLIAWFDKTYEEGPGDLENEDKDTGKLIIGGCPHTPQNMLISLGVENMLKNSCLSTRPWMRNMTQGC